MNTRSLSSAIGLDSGATGPECDLEGAATQTSSKNASEVRINAFKALPTTSSIANDGQERQGMSEEGLVGNICGDIKRASGEMSAKLGECLVKEEDIVSLEEARKSTGLVQKWSYSLKRMVWG